MDSRSRKKRRRKNEKKGSLFGCEEVREEQKQIKIRKKEKKYIKRKRKRRVYGGGRERGTTNCKGIYKQGK